MLQPLVSVITPSLNQGEFIGETLRSVLEQDYPHLEHVVMDGGSTDGTLEVLRDYARRYPGRLTWTSEPDRGQTDAINKGFRRARGEILGWLNADDVYEPGAVRAVAEAFSRWPDAAVIYGRARLMGAVGQDLGPYPVAAPFDWQALAEECYICQPAAFLRRQPLMEVGFLDERCTQCMDYDLWIRLGKRRKIVFVDVEFARARMHLKAKLSLGRRQHLTAAFGILKRHYHCIPLSWCYTYAEFLLHRRDQFFSPPVFDRRVKTLGRLMFLRHNLARPGFVLATLRERLKGRRAVRM